MILEISVDLLFKEMDDQWSISWLANKEIKGKNSYTGKICIDLLLFVKYLIIFHIFETWVWETQVSLLTLFSETWIYWKNNIYICCAIFLWNLSFQLMIDLYIFQK